MQARQDSRKCRWICIAVLLVGLMSMVSLSGFVWTAFQKVMAGNGLETYRTFRLVEFNYVSVLILFGVLVLAFFLAGGLWLWEWWEIRSLERKYGATREK